jgi:hypothetical protein
MDINFWSFIKVLIISFLGNLSLNAQNISKIDFRSPLDIPLYISGNFGEIRSNHPHTGIDFRTLGVTGLNVYAVADGYISRIKIEPEGYGYALYITHPNNYVTLYGHLDHFRNDIYLYCKNEEYKEKSYSIDIQVSPDIFPVKRGDIIAWS